MTLFVGTVNTGRFEWVAASTTEDEVKALLVDAYAAHCSTNPYAESDVMQHLVDEDCVTITTIEAGVVLRDGEPFISPHLLPIPNN